MPLEEAFEDGEPNLFSLLRWNFRLVETLYGRESELSKILKWAKTPSKTPQARLVTAQGGFGKTRLVATAADLLRQEGWSAGFLDSMSDLETTNVGSQGLFLAVDYPEEQPERTTALLTELSQRSAAPYRIRVMFLSRRSFAEWESQAAMLEGRFGRQELAALAPLTVEQCISLSEEAVRNLRRHMEVSELDTRSAKQWFARSESNRIPLYATAVVIHAAVSPGEAFGCGGPQVLKQLALRERERVRKTSLAIGLGEEGLQRLLALGVVADGLDEGTILRLTEAGVCTGAESADIICAIAQTPWWKRGRLARLEPDLLAAAFLNEALFDRRFPEGRKQLPEWLFIAVRNNPEALSDRLERMLHDLDLAGSDQRGTHPLDLCLKQMLEREPDRALLFMQAAGKEVSFWAANFAAHVALALANRPDCSDQNKARMLSNASNHLSVLERHEEAASIAQKAVEISRELAATKTEHDLAQLAMALTNLTGELARTNRKEEGFEVAQEAVAIYRQLESEHPGRYAVFLAHAVSNLAAILNRLHRHAEALVVSREAIEHYRHFVTTGDKGFNRDLAMALHNLALILANQQQLEPALAALDEAVALIRCLAEAHPERYTILIAQLSLVTSRILFRLNRGDEALLTAREGASHYRHLARVNFGAFTPSLVDALQTLRIVLIYMKRPDELEKVDKELAELRKQSSTGDYPHGGTTD